MLSVPAVARSTRASAEPASTAQRAVATSSAARRNLLPTMYPSKARSSAEPGYGNVATFWSAVQLPETLKLRKGQLSHLELRAPRPETRVRSRHDQTHAPVDV